MIMMMMSVTIPSVWPPYDLLLLIIHFSYCFFNSAFLFSFFLYFIPKLFRFFCIQLLVCLREFSTYILGDFFFFVIMEFPVLFVLLEPVWVSLKFPFLQHLLLYHSMLRCQVCLLVCFIFLLLCVVFLLLCVFLP